MRFSNAPLRTLVGTGGLLGGAVLLIPLSPIPDAGTLEPVAAMPAEELDLQTLRSGQTFGEILSSGSLGTNEQRELLLAFQEVASPRRLRVGTEITLRYRRDDGWLRGVDVAMNPDSTLQLTRDDLGWRSNVIQTPVWTDTVFASGEITTDLWTAVVGSPDLSNLPRNDRYNLLDLMDRVFQWQVDFSRQIRTGDSYRVVFERQVRPDGSMRTGRILAAELVNQGKPLYALWFEGVDETSDGGYYDMEGKSVRRAFLTRPLEFRRISSRFNRNRFHPIHRVNRPHIGVDYAADTGTPIQATSDGVIRRRGWGGGYGNVVEIQHANGFMTRYAHMNGFRSGHRVGTRVRQGEVIGYVGMTGTATGPHLHYELHRNGTPIDPLNVRLPSGDPIPQNRWEEWEGAKGVRMALLEKLPAPAAIRMAASGGAVASPVPGDESP
ncbi:MAG: peptidoglycan DD-metalloendopeptidase family protein [Gemmatimonadota bacterium]